MRRSKFLTVLVAAALGMSMVGCGSSGGSSGGTSTGSVANKDKPLCWFNRQPSNSSTGALDTKSGDQVMELFKELNDDGVTIVMITHEPDIARCAKRIMYIRDGELHGEKAGEQE